MHALLRSCVHDTSSQNKREKQSQCNSRDPDNWGRKLLCPTRLVYRGSLLQCTGKWKAIAEADRSPIRFHPLPGKSARRTSRNIQGKRREALPLYLVLTDSHIRPADQEHNPSRSQVALGVIILTVQTPRTLSIVSMFMTSTSSP